MIEIANVVLPSTKQWQAVIRGMRNPMNSWDKSDSGWYSIGAPGTNPAVANDQYLTAKYCIGDNDVNLMKRLVKAGKDHSKFMRMIPVYLDITAPLYWWKEFDTYKVGTVANSCSTMHRLTHKPFAMSDFSFEHLIGNTTKEYFDVELSEEDYDNEEWKPLVRYPMYQISKFGRVGNIKTERVLKLCVNSSGYKKVVLNGKNEYVHRLVAETFIPNPHNLPEVNHKDGNKWNNCVDNLEWVSKSDNAKHAFDLGLRSVSGYTRYKVSQSAHRFGADEIEEIEQMHCSGMTKQEIADKIGCYSSVICNILNGKTYREIEMTPYDIAKVLVDHLNELRELYLETKSKDVWWQIIQLLPSSYNQKRTIMLNYEVLANMYKSRKNHKLDEWVEFCKWIETLPYSELITGEFDV